MGSLALRKSLQRRGCLHLSPQCLTDGREGRGAGRIESDSGQADDRIQIRGMRVEGTWPPRLDPRNAQLINIACSAWKSDRSTFGGLILVEELNEQLEGLLDESWRHASVVHEDSKDVATVGLNVHSSRVRECVTWSLCEAT